MQYTYTVTVIVGIEHFQELLLLYRSPRWEDDATGENLSLLDLLDCGIEDGMAVISDLAEYLSVHSSEPRVDQVLMGLGHFDRVDWLTLASAALYRAGFRERDQARTIVRQDAETERLKARIVLWKKAYEAVYGAISWGEGYPIKLMDELRPGAED